MDILVAALTELSDPFRLVMLFTGVVTGLVVGVVPGIGGIFGLALLIPLTYHLDPYAAFALLLGMSSVINTSDTIPAVLLGVPGTVGAVATVVDGHTMAKKGQAARAFGAAYTSSMIGGLVGAFLLALAIPVMRPLVLYLKTPDFFAISVFGLSAVAMLAGSQPLKGLAAAMLGLLLAFVGIDGNAGTHRWTFGEVHFWEGLPIVVVFLGLFGLPELASMMARGSIQGEAASVPPYSEMLKGAKDALREWGLVIRCGGLGAMLGAIPGVGVAAIDWIAYGHASRHQGEGPRFGHGNVRGVIAPESANNAKEGGSLIPTIAFGVPGSATMAILLGAFTVQGLIPGPEMLGKHASLTASMVFTIAFANILGASICLFLTRPLVRMAGVPATLLVPLVLTFMMIGCYQDSMSVLDFFLLGGVGFLGMAMKELNWPRSAFSLGFVLGPSLEQSFFLAYQIHGWQWLGHPVALGLMLFAVLALARSARSWYRTRKNPRALPAAMPDLVFASFLLAVGLAAFVSAARFPFEAGFFPMVSAAILSALALLVSLQAFTRWRGGQFHVAVAIEAEPQGEWSPTGDLALRTNLRLLAMCAVLAGLLVLLGHLVGGFLFIVASLLLKRAAPLGKSLLCAGGVTLFVYVLFDLVVARPWPAPLLQRISSL